MPARAERRAEGQSSAKANLIEELPEGSSLLAALTVVIGWALCSVCVIASDPPTCDVLTQRLQVHEKTAWMLRSLLE